MNECVCVCMCDLFLGTNADENYLEKNNQRIEDDFVDENSTQKMGFFWAQARNRSRTFGAFLHFYCMNIQ